MLISVDAKALEWRVKVFLSQDKVALAEILAGTDIHSESHKIFNLPDRTTAKNCNFRMIFADSYSDRGFSGPAYAYANDPKFTHVSTSQAFWTKVVEKFFTKYDGMYRHGWDLINKVYKDGEITNPTGRTYKFYHVINKRGEPELPRTLILNYPVQGLAAELMALARVVLRKRLVTRGYDLDSTVLLMNTVHDDIELDLMNDSKLIHDVCVLLEDVFSDLPKLFEQYFKVSFNVPLNGEVSYGHTLGNMVGFKRNSTIIIDNSVNP